MFEKRSPVSHGAINKDEITRSPSQCKAGICFSEFLPQDMEGHKGALQTLQTWPYKHFSLLGLFTVSGMISWPAQATNTST